MQRIMMAAGLVMMLGMTKPAFATSEAQKAKTAEDKAEVLEDKAAPGRIKAQPEPALMITKSEAQAVDPHGQRPLNETITCLARTIYWEAKGAGLATMEAVANVVMNRVGRRGFPNTVCGVVKQGGEEGACQFSWWCDDRADQAADRRSYATAKEIARRALNLQLKDHTGGALFFHPTWLKTDWAARYIRTVQIGDMHFYKPRASLMK